MPTQEGTRVAMHFFAYDLQQSTPIFKMEERADEAKHLNLQPQRSGAPKLDASAMIDELAEVLYGGGKAEKRQRRGKRPSPA